jgi:hypothetical protein
MNVAHRASRQIPRPIVRGLGTLALVFGVGTACAAGYSRAQGSAGAVARLHHATPPADNPLRGFVPYVTADAVERFPHSLEFDYFPLAALMTGPDTFNWDALEASLAVTSERGCQLVMRVYVEYRTRVGVAGFPRRGGCTTHALERGGEWGRRERDARLRGPAAAGGLVGLHRELRVRVPNPMPGGRPLRFANREQGAEWHVLPVTISSTAR